MDIDDVRLIKWQRWVEVRGLCSWHLCGGTPGDVVFVSRNTVEEKHPSGVIVSLNSGVGRVKAAICGIVVMHI